jgi:hypothetical protein
MRKLKIVAALAFLMVFASSCVNEWKQFIEEDIDNIVMDSVELNPSVALRLGSIEFKIADLIEERPDTLIFDGSDSLLTFRLAIDTLYEMPVADVYEMPEIEPITGQSFSMDEIKIDALTANRSITLEEMLTNAGATYPGEGNVIFPPVTDVYAGDYAYDSFEDQFEEVTFASGAFTVTMTNNTPIVVSVVMALRNLDNNTYVGNDVNFTNVAPGATVSQTVNVAGERMYKEVTGELKSFSTPGTIPNFVNIDGEESFVFDVATTQDLVVATATAKIPLTEIKDSTLVDITPADNPELSIKTLSLSSGTINFTVNSNFGAPMNVLIEMPYTKDASGNALSETVTFNGTGSQTQSINLANTTTDLTMNGTAVNSFFVRYKASIGGDDILYTFSSPATATINATFDNVAFNSIFGSLGTIEPFVISNTTLDLGLGELSNKLSGSITITDPSIRLNIKNSFGFGAHLDLSVKGYKNNDTVYVTLPDNTDIAGAQNIGEDAATTILLDKFSTKNTLVDLIALPPAGILFGGKVSVPNTSNVFVTGNSRVLVGFNVEVPLILNLNNVAFTDTMEFDGASLPAEIEEAKLMLKTLNGFPMEIGLIVDVYDSIANRVIHTISLLNTAGHPILLSAAAVDNQGNITPAANDVNLNISKVDYEQLLKGNALILKAMFTTYNAASGNGVPFNANSKIKIDVAIAAKAKINF